MKKLMMTMTGLLSLGITGSALAGGSTIVGGYAGKGGTPVGQVVHHVHKASHTSLGTTRHSGTLPFTGLDLTVFVGLALLLIVLGVLLVRSGRHHRDQA
jgi:hypothetical protein